MTDELRFISPTGVLGIGYPRESFEAAMAYKPHFIACDAGSADWGPYYLGSGEPWAGYHQTRRDLEPLVLGARKAGIPLLIGTAGMSGADVAVDWTFSILEDIARDNGITARVARIYSEQRAEDLRRFLGEGRISAFDGVEELTVEAIEGAARVVAMMGPEPYQRALSEGAEIIIAGRSSDAAVYAAVPLVRGIPPEIAWHMGKITECGPAIAPGSGECIVGGISRDSFWVRTARDSDAVSPTTVAVHMLYENPSPYLLREPPGVLDTTQSKYISLTDGAVEVSGATFEVLPYTVRLEGVALRGYRSICVLGIRDPGVVRQIDAYTSGVVEMVNVLAPERFGLRPDEWSFTFRRYGLDGVLGELEAELAIDNAERCYEIGLIAEVVAPTQELATELLNSSLPFVVHKVKVPGSVGGANAAFAYAPPVLPTGPVYEWTHWHSLALDDPLLPFRIEHDNVGSPT